MRKNNNNDDGDDDDSNNKTTTNIYPAGELVIIDDRCDWLYAGNRCVDSRSW